MTDTQLEELEKKDINYLLNLYDSLDSLGNKMGEIESKADSVRQLAGEEGSEIREFVESEVAPAIDSIASNASLSQEQKKQIAEAVEAGETTKDHLKYLQTQLDELQKKLSESVREVSTVSEQCSNSRDVITQLEEIEEEEM
jgi:predicted RNA-binding protein with EMAP domain